MHPQKSRRRDHGADDSDGVGELGAEPTESVDDEFQVGDGVADVAEGVDKALHLTAVSTNGEVTLMEGVEVLEGVDGALHRIVEEEATNREPEGVRRRATLEHHVAEGLGDGEVEPRHDAAIDLRPLDVVDASLSIDGAVDVVHDAEPLEG